VASSCQSINLYDDIINKVVEITCENEIAKSYATGTLISNDGLILTNKHVINNFDDNSTIKINFYSRGYIWQTGAPAYTRVSKRFK